MMKKIFSNIRTMAALLMAGAAFAACSSSDDTIEQKPAQTGKQVYTLTVNASKAGKASTRALDLDGESLKVTWGLNDELTVENSLGQKLGTLTATSVSGSTATFSGELGGSISSGDALTLTYHPTAIAFNFNFETSADGEKVTCSPSGAFTKQDGTLNGSTKSAENLDIATAEVTVASVDNHKITTTADAVFTTKTALAKVILTDGTNPINATKLKMTGKTYVASKNINLEFDILNFENLSTSITDGIYYFALPSKAAIVDHVVDFLSHSPLLSWIDEATMNTFMETATFTFTATVGDDTYTVEKTGYKFEAGNYYKNVTLTMTEAAPAAKAAAEATAEDKGKLIGTDGNIYADVAAATAAGTTAVAKIIYLGTTGHATYTHGLALALTDEASTMAWQAAIDACSAKNTSTPVTGATWLLASKDQWNYMLGTNGAGSYDALRDGFSDISGANNLLQSDDRYWSSTEYDSSNAWYYHFNSGSWDDVSKNNDGLWVRACLAF